MGVSGVLISGASHFAPGAGALGGDDFGDVVKHQQPQPARQERAARHQSDGVIRHVAFGSVQLEGVLPVLEAAVLSAGGLEFGELRLHALRQLLQRGQRGKRLAQAVVGQRQAEDAVGAGVARLHGASGVQHDDAGGEVVQNGLQARAVLVGSAAGVGQLLRHV